MIFVDTSFLKALFDTTSRFHTRARLHFESMTGSEEVVVVIDEIAKEIFTSHFLDYDGKSNLHEFLNDLMQGKLHNIVYKKNSAITIADAIQRSSTEEYKISYAGYCVLTQAKKYTSAWILSYSPEMQIAAKSLGVRTLA